MTLETGIDLIRAQVKAARFAQSPEHPYFYEVGGSGVWNVVRGDHLETAYLKAVTRGSVVHFRMFNKMFISRLLSL